MKKIDFVYGFSLFFLTVLIYIFTIHPVTLVYNFYLLGIVSLVFFGLFFTNRKNTHVFVYTSVALALLIVGVTGWFESPLFSWLYVLAISLAFIYTPFVANIFVLILVLLFLPSLRTVGLNIELLTISSLLLIIPIAEFLRNRYISLKEKDREILVLKKETMKHESKLNEVLSNIITRESIDLKEPINDIKQIALYYKSPKNHIKKTDIGRIVELANKSLDIIRKFEEESTGEKLATTKK